MKMHDPALCWRYPVPGLVKAVLPWVFGTLPSTPPTVTGNFGISNSFLMCAFTNNCQIWTVYCSMLLFQKHIATVLPSLCIKL